MFASIAAIMVAIGGGIAIGFQSLFSGVIGSRLGTMEAVFIIHLGGLIPAALIMLALRGGSLAAWRTVPWYALFGGLIGIAIIAAISFAVPRLGLATTLTLSIVAQLVLGALLDHFGILGATQRSLDTSRSIGLLVLFVGTWLIVR